MGNLFQAAQEYLVDYSFERAVNFLAIEFGISRGYAMEVCETVEQQALAFDGF